MFGPERAHTGAVDKPAKCRFGRHDWDQRENSETHEFYEICLRCNAYRDDGLRAAPGAGAAGASGANLGGFGM